MKLVFLILFFQFSSVLFSQKVIHYTHLKDYEVNCNEMKTKSDSAFCMWQRSEEDLNDLKRVYNYCPDSLKNYSFNNCQYSDFDSLVACIQNDVKIFLKDKLALLKTDEDRSILYYEYLSIYYFIRRKTLDDYVSYSCSDKK